MDKRKIALGVVSIVFFVLIICLMTCGGESDPNEQNDSLKSVSVTKSILKKDYASGVVLVRTIQYYSVVVNNEVKCYFTGLDEQGNIIGFTLSEEDVEPQVSYGTGFFVSNDGKIATNFHVVAEVIDESYVRSIILNELNNYMADFEHAKDSLSDQIAILSFENKTERTVSRTRRIEKMIEERNELQGIIKNINKQLYAADYSLVPIIVSAVAFNNTYVKSESDMKLCEIIDFDKDHDLAILQLSDKQTPANRHVFELDNTGKIATDDKLYLIGYNKGPELASTSKGIEAQITEGDMNQERDFNFLHTIHASEGSSGSPILNSKGKVVGINYASVADAKEFKFGIKVKYLKELLEKADGEL